MVPFFFLINCGQMRGVPTCTIPAYNFECALIWNRKKREEKCSFLLIAVVSYAGLMVYFVITWSCTFVPAMRSFRSSMERKSNSWTCCAVGKKNLNMNKATANVSAGHQSVWKLARSLWSRSVWLRASRNIDRRGAAPRASAREKPADHKIMPAALSKKKYRHVGKTQQAPNLTQVEQSSRAVPAWHSVCGNV